MSIQAKPLHTTAKLLESGGLGVSRNYPPEHLNPVMRILRTFFTAIAHAQLLIIFVQDISAVPRRTHPLSHHFFRRDLQLIFTLVRVILVKKR